MPEHIYLSMTINIPYFNENFLDLHTPIPVHMLNGLQIPEQIDVLPLQWTESSIQAVGDEHRREAVGYS